MRLAKVVRAWNDGWGTSVSSTPDEASASGQQWAGASWMAEFSNLVQVQLAREKFQDSLLDLVIKSRAIGGRFLIGLLRPRRKVRRTARSAPARAPPTAASREISCSS